MESKSCSASFPSTHISISVTRPSLTGKNSEFSDMVGLEAAHRTWISHRYCSASVKASGKKNLTA
jgi:hypothetical protein